MTTPTGATPYDPEWRDKLTPGDLVVIYLPDVPKERQIIYGKIVADEDGILNRAMHGVDAADLRCFMVADEEGCRVLRTDNFDWKIYPELRHRLDVVGWPTTFCGLWTEVLAIEAPGALLAE